MTHDQLLELTGRSGWGGEKWAREEGDIVRRIDRSRDREYVVCRCCIYLNMTSRVTWVKARHPGSAARAAAVAASTSSAPESHVANHLSRRSACTWCHVCLRMRWGVSCKRGLLGARAGEGGMGEGGDAGRRRRRRGGGSRSHTRCVMHARMGAAMVCACACV